MAAVLGFLIVLLVETVLDLATVVSLCLVIGLLASKDPVYIVHPGFAFCIALHLGTDVTR